MILATAFFGLMLLSPQGQGKGVVTAQNREPKTYVLAIGVSAYQSPQPRLQFAAADARDVADALMKHFDGVPAPGGPAGGLLLDDAANGGAIRREVSRVFRAAEPLDRIILYFSGHGRKAAGSSITGAWVGVDADVVDTNWLVKQANESPARQVLIVSDACFAGVLVTSKSSPELTPDALRANFKYKARDFFVSSTTHQESYESPEFGHGRFTHGLLLALSAASRKTGEFFASDLLPDTERTVRNLAKADEPDDQFPLYVAQLEGRFTLKPKSVFVYRGASAGSAPASTIKPTSDPFVSGVEEAISKVAKGLVYIKGEVLGKDYGIFKAQLSVPEAKGSYVKDWRGTRYVDIVLQDEFASPASAAAAALKLEARFKQQGWTVGTRSEKKSNVLEIPASKAGSSILIRTGDVDYFWRRSVGKLGSRIFLSVRIYP